MMLAMGIERTHHSGPSPPSTRVKVISKLPYLVEGEAFKRNTPSIRPLGTIVMSRSSRQRALSASSTDSKENGEYQLSKHTKFSEYKNSPKMVPKQADLQSPGDFVKRRTLSDSSSAIRAEDSPTHRPGPKSGNPYKTLRPQASEKVVRKVSFSDDLVIISDNGEVKARRSHSARQVRHRDLSDSDDHRPSRTCRYMHFLKGREEPSHSEDLDVVYHGLTSLLGTKSKKDTERKTTKVQSSDKSTKQKVTKALSIPSKKVKKGSPHSGSV